MKLLRAQVVLLQFFYLRILNAVTAGMHHSNRPAFYYPRAETNNTFFSILTISKHSILKLKHSYFILICISLPFLFHYYCIYFDFVYMSLNDRQKQRHREKAHRGQWETYLNWFAHLQKNPLGLLTSVIMCKAISPSKNSLLNSINQGYAFTLSVSVKESFRILVKQPEFGIL